MFLNGEKSVERSRISVFVSATKIYGKPICNHCNSGRIFMRYKKRCISKRYISTLFRLKAVVIAARFEILSETTF